jgi:leucyl aminopeptidase
MLRVRATTDAPSDAAADTVAIGVFDGDENSTPPAPVASLFESGEAQTKRKHLALTHAERKRWLAVGLGARDSFDGEAARLVAAAVVGRAAELGTTALYWDGPEPGAFVEGALLASYRYENYKTKDEEDKSPRLDALLVRTDEDLEPARVMAEAQNLARDLQNGPANEMTPSRLAARAREIAAEFDLQCEVLGREQIRYAGMGAFSAVAQGAAEEPQLITLKYSPEGASGPVLGLVGKAVTFDTGGISLKPFLHMSAMKSDMSGGAAVLEAMGAIARLGLPVCVVAVVGATNNDIGSGAMKPGDIVRARSGTTIEILNTDAEGRLVLCDCLVHAREQGAERLVDVATLTGGIVTTFGNVYAGLMGTDDAWCESVRAAGERVGELLWRLPLHEDYAELLKGQWSDLVNVNENRKSTSIVGGEFLRKFVGDTPWVHLDIAGVMWDRGRAYAPKGGSGFATRTLIEVARGMTT